MILLTRTKKKIIGLEGFGLKIKKQKFKDWKMKIGEGGVGNGGPGGRLFFTKPLTKP